MKLYVLRLLVVLLVVSFAGFSGDATEIRGFVATGSNTWTADYFTGFYYDVDKNIATEYLTTTVSDGNVLLGTDGVVYGTTAQSVGFDFEEWGNYNLIGFLGHRYFAGYPEGADAASSIFYHESEDECSLASGQLQTILMDSADETILMPGAPLELAEGYELAVKYIDENGLYLELSNNGTIVDSKVMSLSKGDETIADRTYCYARDVGDQKKLVIIAAHIKNALKIENKTVATVDGLWQISDNPLNIDVGAEYGKMTVQNVDDYSITMSNVDNQITLSKDKEFVLMPGISMRTANSDDLRYYIFSEDVCECG